MAQLIKVDGSREEVKPRVGSYFDLGELQGYVGGLIELAPLLTYTGEAVDKFMFVDEEGLLKQKPQNPTASVLAGRVIVGDALLCDPNEVKSE